MTVPKFRIIKVKTYKPGKSKINKVKKSIKLSANESALGLSPKVKKILFNKNKNLSKYPDSRSEDLRLSPSYIYLGFKISVNPLFLSSLILLLIVFLFVTIIPP